MSVDADPHVWRTVFNAFDRDGSGRIDRDELTHALGLVVAWMLFYAAARVLLSIPAEFHDGTLWEE